MRIIKRLTAKAMTFTVTVAVILALIITAAMTVPSAFAAETEDTKEFASVSLDVSNPQFSSSSGSYPASPSSWTGGYLGGGKGNIVSGVVDLAPSAYNSGSTKGNVTFKLDQYDEFTSEDNIPRTIFGDSERYPDTDAKTLLINTPKGSETAYAYTSSEMSFKPDSFYRVSAWVKTGDFAVGGATVKLTGLGVNCSFNNINTVADLDGLNKDNDYGWKQYTFYVRTGVSITKTVKLSLGIGDAAEGTDEDAESGQVNVHGYAFFDTVTAEQISAYDFAFETSDFEPTERDGVYLDDTATSLAIDLYDTDYLTVNDKEIGTFSANTDLWNTDADYSESDDDDSDYPYVGTANVEFFDSERRFTELEGNDYGFTQNPWSPLGKAEVKNDVDNAMFAGNNANILLISTYDGKKFATGTRGVASPDITVKRFGYYRLSVWVKGDNVSGGDGISVGIKGQSNNSANNGILADWTTGLEGASDDASHYGWKEHIFYIQGSVISDLDIHFELRLGSPSNPSSGIAMFDNVTFREVSYTEYKEMSEADSGKLIQLDGTVTSTGVENGNFMNIGEYDEFKFPLPAADWTHYTTDKVESTGFSDKPVEIDGAVYGIIPTDEKSFDKLISDGAIPSSVNNPKSFAKAPDYNVLLLSSPVKTAFCYRSPAITVAADKGYKISVDMAVDGVTDGYGASLVLKTDSGTVVSTIENIKTTNDTFKTYTFYVNAPLSEKTLNVEIWLGLNDRKDNSQKLSDGNIYVKKVAAEEWTAAEGSTVSAEYDTMFEQYKADIANAAVLKSIDYGMYSFNAPTLAYYDAYGYNTDNTSLATPYGWTVSSANNNVRTGLFDSDNMKNIDIAGFEKKDRTGNMLYVYNIAAGRTTYTYDNSISLVANTYYKLDVTIKVRVDEATRKSDKIVGANIKLTGTKTESFENIKDTTTLISQGHEDTRDYETFKTYTFYIATGSNGGNIGLDISFGGDDARSYIQGELFIADVSLTQISNSTAYDEYVSDLNKNYEKAVALSDTTPDETDTEATSSDLDWWVLPTIIVSACMLAAIVIIFIVRIRDKIKKKRKITYTSEYDRSDTIRELDKLKEQLEGNTEDESGAREVDYEEIDEADIADKTSEEPATDANDDGATADAAESDRNNPEQPKSDKPKEADDLDD